MELQRILLIGFQKVIVEGDCKKAMDVLNNRVLQFVTYNWVRDIRWWKDQFEEIKFVSTNRETNWVADILAKNPIPGDASFWFYNYVPICITSVLHKDYVLSSN